MPAMRTTKTTSVVISYHLAGRFGIEPSKTNTLHRHAASNQLDRTRPHLVCPTRGQLEGIPLPGLTVIARSVPNVIAHSGRARLSRSMPVISIPLAIQFSKVRHSVGFPTCPVSCNKNASPVVQCQASYM